MTDAEARSLKEEYVEARQGHGEYIRLPVRLAQALKVEETRDKFGIEARYAVVRAVLQERQPLGRVVDIGGNCGYFPLSLLDEGLVQEVVVYDIKAEVLKFGERMAASMGLACRCRFITAAIALDTLDRLPDGDVIICQNLIHHAGVLFDEAPVQRQGWEGYAADFLRRLRAKYRIGVLGIGFKDYKPVNWNIPSSRRPERFREILRAAGWRVLYDRSVYEVMKSGGAYPETPPPRRHPVRAWLLSAAWHLAGRRGEKRLRHLVAPRAGHPTEKYHLYLAERAVSCEPV